MMFETFYESVKPSIHSPFNCVTAIVHYVLVRRGFKCIGMNEELFTSGSIPSTIRSSELMPEKWSSNDKKVSLIYQQQHNNKCHVMLKVVHAADMALLHLMKNTDGDVGELSVPYKDHVGTSYARYDEAYVNVDGLIELIERRLLDPLLSKAEKKKEKRGSQSTEPPPHFTQPPHVHPPTNPFHPLLHQPPHPILPCGRNDLDPLGHRNPPTGGMIFDPLAMYGPRHRHPLNIDPSNIPPGSVPPGARFDPLNPFPQPGGIFGPDPDEMPRPGFDDPFNF